MAIASAVETARWLPGERVRELSKRLGDPAPVARLRREAGERVAELPMEPDPLYRLYGYFAGVDLAGLDPLASGPPVAVPPVGERTVQVVHDASGTRCRLSPDVPADAVRFVPLDRLWTSGDDRAEAFFAPDGAFTDRLAALGAATLNRGYRLEIGGTGTTPVRVQDLSILSQPHEGLSVRRELKLGEGATVIATEEAFGTPIALPGQRWLSSDTRLSLGRGAKAAVLTVHAVDTATVGGYSRTAELGPESRLTWMWNGIGGFRTKIRNRTTLAGNASDVEDLQTFFGDHVQSYDSSIRIEHVGRDTHGQSITRGVFRDQARGMSRGLVRIEAEARGTLSYLSEHAMLLSKGARSDTIPILEILCRDVKATHSTSVAPVDPEKVFYLESRGMTTDSAIRMIGEGFLAHVLDRSPIGHLRDLLYPHLATRWDGGEIPWKPDTFPCLPSLKAGADATGSDWRFDAKLRTA